MWPALCAGMLIRLLSQKSSFKRAFGSFAPRAKSTARYKSFSDPGFHCLPTRKWLFYDVSRGSWHNWPVQVLSLNQEFPDIVCLMWDRKSVYVRDLFIISAASTVVLECSPLMPFPMQWNEPLYLLGSYCAHTYLIILHVFNSAHHNWTQLLR